MIRPLALVALSSFVLHMVWERLHIHLYSGYEAMEGVLPVFLLATIGDVAYTLVAVCLVTLFKGGFAWLREARTRDYVGLALLGFFIALFVEYKAQALGRWVYTDAMPLVGGIGLSPILQMVILLPLAVYITVRLERVIHARNTPIV